jgi:multiple sugar transport system permease protein
MAPTVLVAPAVVIFLAVGIMPLVYSLYMSLTNWILTRPVPPKLVGLANYAQTFQDGELLKSLFVTAIYLTVTVGLEFALGLGIALVAFNTLRGLSVFRVGLLIPMALPPIVVGLTWRLIYSPVGPLNWLLHLLGLHEVVWLGNRATALPAVMAVDIWQWTPFMFLLLYAGLLSLPSEVLEAAAVDGAGLLLRLRYIILPMLQPVIAIALMFRLIDAIKTFDIAYILTGGGPANATELISLYVFKVGLNFFHLGYASAVSYILVALTTILSVVVFRFLDPISKTRGAGA